MGAIPRQKVSRVISLGRDLEKGVKDFPDSVFFILPMTGELVELKQPIGKIELGIRMPPKFSSDKQESQSG